MPLLPRKLLKQQVVCPPRSPVPLEKMSRIIVRYEDPGMVQESFVCPGSILGSCWVSPWDILGLFWVHLGSISHIQETVVLILAPKGLFLASL